MKNFLLGIFAATLAGILIYAAQFYFDDYFKSPRASLEHTTFSPALIVSRRELNTWLPERSGAAGDAGLDRAKVTLLNIENTGNEALSNHDVRIQPREDFGTGVVAFHNQAVPGGDPSATNTRLMDRSLLIRYNLFNPGELHSIWVVTDQFTDFEVISRRPGLQVQGWRRGVAYEEDNGMTPGWFFAYAVMAIILFVFGAFVNDRIARSELRKRGINYQEILAQPAVSDGDKND